MEIKSKPIFFNTKMVRAILDDRKTLTRRVVEGLPNPLHPITEIVISDTDNAIHGVDKKGNFVAISKPNRKGWLVIKIKPYSKKGNILWVRETYHIKGGLPAIEKLLKANFKDKEDYLIYKADLPESEWKNYKWTPSIFMRKNACRLWLRVLNIRVERLQDINEEDAVKEGIKIIDNPEILRKVYRINVKKRQKVIGFETTARCSLSILWDSIYGNTNYTWSNNPWVYVIEFKRI